MEHDAASGFQIAHPGDNPAAVLDAGGGGEGVLLRAGAADVPGSRLFEIPLEFVDKLVEAALLIDARRFPCELGAVEVGLRGEASRALDEGPEALARAHVIDAGCVEFAFEAGLGVLLRDGDADIGLGEDGHHVPGAQLQVLGLIAFEDEFAGIERDQFGLQVACVLALDDGIVPVDLGDGGGDIGPG